MPVKLKKKDSICVIFPLTNKSVFDINPLTWPGIRKFEICNNLLEIESYYNYIRAAAGSLSETNNYMGNRRKPFGTEQKKNCSHWSLKEIHFNALIIHF